MIEEVVVDSVVVFSVEVLVLAGVRFLTVKKLVSFITSLVKSSAGLRITGSVVAAIVLIDRSESVRFDWKVLSVVGVVELTSRLLGFVLLEVVVET